MNAKSCHPTPGLSGHQLAPVVLALAALLLAGTGGCRKSPEEEKAEKAALIAQTTGRLTVKSNRPSTTIEATRLAAAGEAPAAVLKGNEDGATEHNFTALPPGTYAVIARSAGWPDIRQEANIIAGQATEVAVQFKSGSLRVESIPVGATVKFAGTSLGKTPLTVPQLPPGEISLTLEYPLWPVLPFRVTITENQETAETVRMPHGRLVVESNPEGATVLFNRRVIGQTPLTIERYQAGNTKLTLQAKDFPPMELAIEMEDRGEVKLTPVLAMAFPEMDPTSLLAEIWVEPPDEKDRLAPAMKPFTTYPSRNGVIKNLDRKKLAEQWLDKPYRFIAIIKNYDRDDGQIEFAEEKSDLARYRVLAKLSPSARNDRELTARLVKDSTFSLYGYLTAVEEPVWPARVITLEFSAAEALP